MRSRRAFYRGTLGNPFLVVYSDQIRTITCPSTIISSEPAKRQSPNLRKPHWTMSRGTSLRIHGPEASLRIGNSGSKRNHQTPEASTTQRASEASAEEGSEHLT